MQAQPVERVHLIFKTHLDIGFTDYAHKVAERYRTSFIPAAIELAAALRARGGPERFIWTTGSWLIHEYLEHATPPQREVFEAAIAAGDIVWHALPCTTHSELMDQPLFEYGLSLARDLDARYGRTTIAAKMTDVPGHTRGIVPLLAAAGVRFLHIGVNPASTPPDVPPVFVWQHPDGADVVVMYQRGGYGDCVVVPGMTDALMFAHTGDNIGPPSIDDTLAIFAAARERFPGATVLASTLDAYAACLESVRAQLPRVTAEIGDTWIHGAGSDPAKVARFRELLRLRRQWLADGRVQHDDPALQRFHRAMLLVAEHTWGMDEKTHLAEYTAYAPAQLRAVRHTPRFAAFEASWAEQRGYLDQALAALAELDAARAAEARERLAALTPLRPSTAGWTRLDPADTAIATDEWTLCIDPHAGAITRLRDNQTGREWADREHPLALFRYQSFADTDYARFYRRYNINKRAHGWWAREDYTKPGIGAAGATAAWWKPQLMAVWRRDTGDALHLLVELTMPDPAVERFGSPRCATLELVIRHGERRVELDFQWFEKQANRLPEALWLSFVPQGTQPHGWNLHKLGYAVSPLDVVRYGNRRLHAVDAVSYGDRRGGLRLDTLDAPLLAPGDPSLLRFTTRQPAMRHGVHLNLYNNIWGTNFPMWYDEDGRARVTLSFA